MHVEPLLAPSHLVAMEIDAWRGGPWCEGDAGAISARGLARMSRTRMALHNHGFLHVETGKWRLSPAFDVNPFPDRERELKTWITEHTGPAMTIEALLSATPYFAIPVARARMILSEVDAFEHDERAAAQS